MDYLLRLLDLLSISHFFVGVKSYRSSRYFYIRVVYRLACRFLRFLWYHVSKIRFWFAIFLHTYVYV